MGTNIGCVNCNYNEYYNNLKKKNRIATAAALIGTSSLVGAVALDSKINNPKIKQIGLLGGLVVGLVGACFSMELAEKIDICKQFLKMNENK